jgi:hypothetical protein
MNRMLWNLVSIKPGVFTNSITINLCLTKRSGRMILPCRDVSAYHKSYTILLFREHNLERDRLLNWRLLRE